MKFPCLLANNLALFFIWSFVFSTFQTTSAAPAAPQNPFADPPKNPFDENNSDVEVVNSDSECDTESITTDGKGSSIEPTSDGPTSDGSPGIGVEFESTQFIFTNKECKQEHTFASKGKEVDGRSGKDWSLTVDTTESHAGRLTAEYILDGKKIKLGSQRAKQAAEEVKKDLDEWQPSTGSCDIELLKPVNGQCKTWSILNPSREGAYKNLLWLYQVTAPLPLSGINALFRQAKMTPTSPLLPLTNRKTSSMFWVNKDFFQSAPNSMCDPDEDVLGFYSLLLSYIKKIETQGKPSESPKHMSTIMPRTDFAVMFNDVKSKIEGDPYELARVLLCYTNVIGEEYTDFDSMWCDGTPDSPKPKSDIDEKMTVQIEGTNPHSKKNEKVSFTLKDWIEGLQGRGKKLEEANKADGTSGAKDLMSYYDRWVDGQIGGLKGAKEHLHRNAATKVPLFEFRDIDAVPYEKFPETIERLEREVLRLHGS